MNECVKIFCFASNFFACLCGFCFCHCLRWVYCRISRGAVGVHGQIDTNADETGLRIQTFARFEQRPSAEADLRINETVTYRLVELRRSAMVGVRDDDDDERRRQTTIGSRFEQRHNDDERSKLSYRNNNEHRKKIVNRSIERTAVSSFSVSYGSKRAILRIATTKSNRVEF